MNDELDFAGAYAILLALLLSGAWLIGVTLAGVIKLEERIRALQRRLQRRVPEYRNPRFH